MQYKILHADENYEFECIEKLESKVNEYLKAGWKLQGGVSIAARAVGYRAIYTACQAMVKED